MKKLLLPLFLLPLMTACEKSDNPSYYNLESAVSLSVQDQGAADLLDPASEKSLDLSTLKIKYLDSKNQFVEYYNPMMDMPHGYSIWKSGPNNNFHPAYYGDYYVLHVAIENYTKISDGRYEATTLIEWTPDNIDTLECEIQEGPNWTRITQVTINHDQTWDITSGQKPDFTKVTSGEQVTFTRHVTIHE